MELPVCSQEGRHHFSPCLPADSPLPGPSRDLDHPRKHCHSSCPLTCLFILTLPKTNRSRRRSWHPCLPHVVLPGPSPGPPTQICFWIPHCLCHTSFQMSYEQQRENEENHIILMNLPTTTTTSSLTSPHQYQQPNLPFTCQRSTPLPPTPGNYSLYSLLSSPLLPSPSFLPHCWWLCNLLYQKRKRYHPLIYSYTHSESPSSDPHLWWPYLLQPSLLWKCSHTSDV